MKKLKVIGAPSHVAMGTGGYPFICHQPSNCNDGDGCLVFRLEFLNPTSMTSAAANSPFGTMSLQVTRYAVDLVNQTSDYEEMIVNTLLTNGEHVGKTMVGSHFCVDINKVSNEIAAETRRGSANHILCHVDDYSRVDASLHSMMQSFYTIHPLDVPQLKGKLVIMYKGKSGEFDGSPILATSKTGTSYGWVGLADASKYVKVLDFP